MKRIFVSLLLLWCSSAFGGVLQTATQSSGFFTGSGAASFASLPTAGHAVVVVVSSFKGTALSVSDNQGNTYTQVGVIDVIVSGNNVLSGVFWNSSIGAPSGTFTVTATATGATAIDVSILEASGVSALDQTGSVSSTSAITSLTATASAPNAQANDLVVAVCGLAPSGTSGITTPSTGYTTLATRDNAGTTSNEAYKTVSAVETSSAAWTFASQPGGGALVVTFKPAGSGPPKSQFFFASGGRFMDRHKRKKPMIASGIHIGDNRRSAHFLMPVAG